MLSNLVKLEHVVEGKAVQLLCAADAQIPHIKEALFAFMKYVGNVEDQVKAQQESAKNQAEANAASAPPAPNAAEMPTPE